jgi:hypothetical protein
MDAPQPPVRNRVVGALPALLFCASLALAQEPRLKPGAELPVFESVSLSGEPRTLPHDAAGQDALLVVGFSKAAAKVTRGWLDACRGAGRLACYDVRMLEEVPHPFRGMMEHGMRSGLPVEQQKRALLVYSDNDRWRERLDADDDKSAYLVGLNAEGRVQGLARGSFSDAGWKQVLEWWSIR